MSFQPATSLNNRNYLGLICSQFLAAFNDQCIHAAAMFYAIRQGALTEEKAITLMPILFFTPWAIFCTLAGYLSDRYSKRATLVFWKFAEIAITLVTLTGFYLGSQLHLPVGPYLVLSTVFLMGTHSAFFVPAKYGILPEILPTRLLSKGNGLLESTSFLAVILGTVAGGLLSDHFHRQEYWIGVILVGLAVVGAVASLVIQRVPAANPTRTFNWLNPLKPLFTNLGTMARSRALLLAMLGIAFFTFMVAFMRGTMYLHGETRIPRWSESHTSLIVATVALGVGLGSPLAGFLSGGKVQLAFVTPGALGMIVGAVIAAAAVFSEQWLIVALILIGISSGFYIVPLYTLLQHRAPKSSKGDLIATSNFINVTGGIVASGLLLLCTTLAHRTGFAPEVPQTDLFTGKLETLARNHHGRPCFFEVAEGSYVLGKIGQIPKEDIPEDDDEGTVRIEVEESLIEFGRGLDTGATVTVSRYTLPETEHRPRPIDYYRVRLQGQPMRPAYDSELLPRYLFIGAGALTALSLILLQLLRRGVSEHDEEPLTAKIPEASAALLTEPEAAHPTRPSPG